MLTTLLDILHVIVCAILIFVVLLQQGRGGGMGSAFGGAAATQVFGGRGAGNLLTRATGICAGLFMLTSVSLAYLSSSGDRALKARAVQEAKASHGDKGTARPKDKDAPATGATGATGAGTTTGSTGGGAGMGGTDTPASPAAPAAPAAPVKPAPAPSP